MGERVSRSSPVRGYLLVESTRGGASVGGIRAGCDFDDGPRATGSGQGLDGRVRNDAAAIYR